MAARRWLQWLKKALASGGKTSPGRNPYRPSLESLEDRRVLNHGPWGGHLGLGHGAAFLAAEEPSMSVVSEEQSSDSSAHPSHEAGGRFHRHHHGEGGNREHDHSAEDSTTATNVNQIQTYTEGDAVVELDDIVVTAENADDTVTATLTLANPAAGNLTAASDNGETYDAETGVWTVTGSVDTVNAALAAVAFIPAADNDTDTTIAVDIRSSSDGSSDTGRGHCGSHRGQGEPDGTIALNVATAGEALTATNLDQTKTFSAATASVDLDDIVVSATNGAATITASLTLANPAAGSLTADSGNGETYDSSTGVWTVSGSVAQVNAALAALLFEPNTDNAADTTISVAIRDAAGAGPDGIITLTLTNEEEALRTTLT